MNKHQYKTYIKLGIDTNKTSLDDNDIIIIFNKLESYNLNWKNEELKIKLLSIRRDYPSYRYLCKFINQIIQPEGKTPITVEYWIKRGFDQQLAEEKSRAVLKNRENILKIEYWTNRGYTVEQAKLEVAKEQSNRSKKSYQSRDKLYRQRKSPRSIQYWLNKGYTIEEAKHELDIIADTHSKILTGRKNWVPLQKRNTNILFYIAMGLNEAEAKLALRKRQTTRQIPPEIYDKFLKYYTECWWYTKQNLHLVSNINLRSKEYHLDHIFSIYDGFQNNIDPIIIGSHINLRIITAKQNLQKQRNSDITKEALLYEYAKLDNRNTANF